MNDTYLSFSSDDLALDQSFINYVKNPHGQEAAQWKKWLNAHPSMQGEADLASQLILDLQIEPVETSGAPDRIWESISDSIAEQNTKIGPHRKIRFLRIASAVAAGLALLIAFKLFFPTTTTYESAYGHSLNVDLPDASAVHLNAGSKLSFDDKTYDHSRELHLRGEAFFDVKKGAPFTVHTEAGSVQVLGTSFNIYSRNQAFEVQCFTGKVLVRHQDQQVEVLPGENSRIADDGTLTKHSFELEKHRDWRSGTFTYDDAPLLQVLAEIERQFEVSIEVSPSIGQLAYTGFFEKGNLTEALHSVCWPLKLDAEITGSSVVINKVEGR